MKKPSAVFKAGDYEMQVIRSTKDTWYILRIVQKYSTKNGGKVRKRMYLRTDDLKGFFNIYVDAIKYIGISGRKITQRREAAEKSLKQINKWQK